MYDRWNEAIEATFFDGRSAGKPVYLDLDDDALAELALHLELDPDNVVSDLNTVVGGTFVHGVRPFRWHRQRLSTWIDADREDTPPFLALLASLSTVASAMKGTKKFGPGNYYGRFREMHNIPESEKGRFDKAFRGTTPRYWDELNSWLSRYDGARGLPTASVYDFRRFVGLPLSQVMLKSADRRTLATMFNSYGLRPGQYLTPEDLTRLIDEWVKSEQPSVLFQRQWGKKTNRKHIADIVSTELSNWKGPEHRSGQKGQAGDGIPVSSGLELLAWLRLGFRPSLYLSLGISATAGYPEGPYSIDPTGDMARTMTPEQTVTFELNDAEGYLLPDDNGSIRYGEALFALLRLRHADGSEVNRLPQRIVVFSDEDGTGRYAERSNIEMGTPSIALVNGPLITAVIELLAGHAREGFKIAEADSIAGVPDGWILITGIQLLSVPESTDINLQPLLPLSWTKVTLAGGLKLPGHSTWHRDAQPEIVTTSSGTEEYRAKLKPLDEESDEIVMSDGIQGAGAFSLPSSVSQDGDYLISLFDSGKDAIATRTFHLRSGDRPRLHVADPDPIGWSPIDVRWPFAATTNNQPTVSGHDAAELPRYRTGSAEPLVDSSFSGAADEDERPQGIFEAPLSEPPICQIGGAHHWILPTVGKSGPKDVDGTCKRCGATKWFPAKPKNVGSKDSLPSFTPALIKVSAAKQTETIAPELLIDSLVYLASGSWGEFTRIVSQFDQAPWFATEVAQNLALLGFIELGTDPETMNVRRWALAPSVHVQIGSSGLSYLSGPASSNVLHAAESTTSRASYMPPLVTLPESGVADLRTLIDPHLNLIDGLPNLVAARHSLPTAAVPTSECERYEYRTGRWIPSAAPDRPGAYRFTTWPRIYSAWDGVSKEMHLGSADLVKWIAAGTEPMLSYSEENQQLTVRRGAELPALYGRVAVLPSGILPQDNQDGTMTYSQITSDLAARIAAKTLKSVDDA